MNPLVLLFLIAGATLIVFGFVQIFKRRLLTGLIAVVVGLILIGLPVVIGSLLAVSNP